MRHAISSFAVLALIATLAACAGGRDGPRTPITVDMGPRDGGGRDIGVIPPTDLGPPPAPDLGPRDMGPPDLGRRCVTGCTTDSACQTSCPPNPTPTLPVCCDRSTGTCFNASVSMCPAPTATDGGMMMSL